MNYTSEGTQYTHTLSSLLLFSSLYVFKCNLWMLFPHSRARFSLSPSLCASAGIPGFGAVCSQSGFDGPINLSSFFLTRPTEADGHPP